MITGPVMKNLYGLKKYGLTKQTYFKMLEDCDNKCMICNQPPKTKALHIEHNHRMMKQLKKQGKDISLSIRGLCCFSCNSRLLGRLADRPDAVELFLKAAEYLLKYEEKINER